jgi:tetratricopeptide (TPR) repeat protein
MRQHDHAEADFNRAIELDPRNPFILARRGSFYLSGQDFNRISKQDYDHAIADLDEALMLDPKYGLRARPEPWLSTKITNTIAPLPTTT